MCFFSNVVLCIMAKYLCFCLVCLFICDFANLGCAAILFREKRLSLGHPPNRPYLFTLFLIVLRPVESEMGLLGFLQFLLALHGLTFYWDVHSWEDCGPVPDHKNCQNVCFPIGAHTLIKCIWLSSPGCYLPSYFLWNQEGYTDFFQVLHSLLKLSFTCTTVYLDKNMSD